MKKKKILKTASLVALSAVMMSGAAVAFAGCGDDPKTTLTINIFCGESDANYTRTLCQNWAKEYTKKLVADGTFTEDMEVNAKFDYNSDTTAYFDALIKQMSSNSAADVFYVSPKYVKAWTKLGRILDLTSYLEDSADVLNDVWENALGYYGYSEESAYTQGETVTWDAAAKSFKTVSGSATSVGIYGLPKDYSNFGLGFNNRFFSQEMRNRYQTLKATDERNVKGAEYAGAALTYEGGMAEDGVVTYAVSGDGFTKGDNAPIINPGIPTTYRPYNFYKYPNYLAAEQGGDPMALAVKEFTGGAGYTVTIPGYPGDTFADTFTDTAHHTMPADKQNADAVYDSKEGYITYTYEEYGALTWALTYYLNTFAWDTNTPSSGSANREGDVLNGTGGVVNAIGTRKNIYGNDQYDGVLYLLPWLAGNNSNYIDSKGTTVKNGTEKINKLQLDGTYQDVDVNYGVDSDAFIETLGHFLGYGAFWNGNSNNVGDTNATKDSGWLLFNAGACVFYGVGTWNAIELNKTDRDYLEYGLMPEPVSEDYALYTEALNGDYVLTQYGTEKQSGAKAWTETQIYNNQVNRQDKWGARMDTVGFGVNANLAGDRAPADQKWKAAAAVDLIKLLTINKETQVSLTYAGSQLPNFKSQCIDYLHYNDADYIAAKKAEDPNYVNAFADMITPDDAAWDTVYAEAKALFAASTGKDAKSTTVATYFSADNKKSFKYDPQYATMTLDSVSDLSIAMKVLRLVSYTKSARDLSLRMQMGLNSVRDAAMYTYKTGWLDVLETRGLTYMLAYRSQEKLEDRYIQGDNLYTAAKFKAGGDKFTKVPSGNSYATPAWYCLYKVNTSQQELEKAIADEKAAYGGK